MKKILLFFALMFVIGFLQPVKSDFWPPQTTQIVQENLTLTTAQRLQEQANQELLALQRSIHSTCMKVVYYKRPVGYGEMMKILDLVDYYESRQEWWDEALTTKYKIRTTVTPLSKDVLNLKKYRHHFMVYRDKDGTVALSLMAITGKNNIVVQCGVRGKYFFAAWIILWLFVIFVIISISNKFSTTNIFSFGSTMFDIFGLIVFLGGILLSIFW